MKPFLAALFSRGPKTGPMESGSVGPGDLAPRVWSGHGLQRGRRRSRH